MRFSPTTIPEPDLVRPLAPGETPSLSDHGAGEVYP